MHSYLRNMANKVVAEAKDIIDQGELVQHGDVHVKSLTMRLMTIAAACSCCHCSSIADKWRRRTRGG